MNSIKQISRDVYCPLYKNYQTVYIRYMLGTKRKIAESNGCENMCGSKICIDCMKTHLAEFQEEYADSAEASDPLLDQFK